MAARVCLLSAAAVAVVAVALGTWRGIGIGRDSVSYVAQARELRDGRPPTLPVGVAALYGQVDQHARDAVLTLDFPPLYPGLLAVVALVVDPVTGARWLNAFLLAATALLCGALIGRHTGSRSLACLGAAVAATSPVLIGVHLWALSEAPFIVVGLLALWALARFADQPSVRRAALSGVAVGLATVMRYAGLALLPTGTVVLLLTRGSRGARAVAVAVFLAASSPPLAAWVVLARRERAFSSRTLEFDPLGGHGFLDAESLRVASLAIRRWFVYGVLPWPIEAVVAGAGIVAVVVAVGIALARPAANELPGKPVALPLVAAIFLVVYPLFLFAASAVVGAVFPDERALVPMYPAALVLLGCLAPRLRRQPARLAALVLVAAVALPGVYNSGEIVDAARRYGLGYSGYQWRLSPTFDVLPAGKRLYSNFPDAVYARTSRPAYFLPPKVYRGGTPNRRYRAEVDRLAGEVRRGDAAIVYFESATRQHVVRLTDLTHGLGLPTRGVTSDAVILARD